MADPITGNVTDPTQSAASTPNWLSYTGQTPGASPDPSQAFASPASPLGQTASTATGAPAPTTGAAGQNWANQLAISDPTIGTNISSPTGWLSGINQFLTSPVGQLAGAAVPAGVGLYQAGQANRQAQNLAGQITAAAAPTSQLSAATLAQLRGGPSVGGPLGNVIAGQTGAAGTLAQTAQQYGTGQLTPAQQQQVSQYASAQKAAVASQLAQSGNLDSSTRATMNESIDNNAAMLAQSLVAGNMQIATGALSAVNNTYNSLLGNALSQAGLGVDATNAAVKQQIASDQQTSGYLQQLMAAIASGLSGAGGGKVSQQGGQPGAQQPTAAGQLGTSVASGLQKWLGGGTTPAAAAPGAADFTAQQQGIAQNYLATSGATAPGMASISDMAMPSFNIDTSSLTADTTAAAAPTGA